MDMEINVYGKLKSDLVFTGSILPVVSSAVVVNSAGMI
jgi:hypothetical protein